MSVLKTEQRYVIHSRSWGVYLGRPSEDSPRYPLPLGYWSNRNPGARALAPTFQTMDDVQKEIAEWPFLRWVPSDLSYHSTRSIIINDRWVATRIACIDAGLPGW